MSIKIIAADLDGTLLAADHRTVTPRTVAAISGAQEKGAKFVIATGRTLGFIEDVLRQVPMTDYVIYSNGAAIYDCKAKKIIYSRPIPKALATQITDYIAEKPIFYNIYADGRIYTPISDTPFSPGNRLPADFLQYYMSKNVPCNNAAEVINAANVELIVCYFGNIDERTRVTALLDDMPNLAYASSVMENVEIMAAEAGKGEAIAALLELLGASADEIMCFGDSNNDCSMLRAAHFSYAMANGDKDSHHAARFEAPSNSDEGVAKIIEREILGK